MWLTEIAVHPALGRLWRAKSDEELPEQMGTSDNPEQTAYGRELQTAIEQALDTRAPLYRNAFVMRRAEGMGVTETDSRLPGHH